MTILGLDEKAVTEAVRAVRPGRDEPPAEIFARAAWSGISEPGDAQAGLVVQTLGAHVGLSAVVDGWTKDRLASVIAAEADAKANEIYHALGDALERWAPRLVASTALRSLTSAARLGASLLVPEDDVWPAGLFDLQLHAPHVLWCRGSEAAVAKLSRSVALVGSRAATGYGQHVASEAAAGLVSRGYAIVSGGAFGIDGISHKATILSGGTTIAFLAGGVDRFYPTENDDLFRRIIDTGAVLAELPPGSAPTKWRFLERNRLIVAASQATVVVEGAYRSGSLNSASKAAALGRPLGAVPGPVTSASSAGCHRIIRDYNATLVTNAAEIAELAEGIFSDADFELLIPQEPDEHRRVLDAMSSRGRAVEEIARNSGMSISGVRAALGALDLDGRVIENESGWRIAPKSRG